MTATQIIYTSTDGVETPDHWHDTDTLAKKIAAGLRARPGRIVEISVIPPLAVTRYETRDLDDNCISHHRYADCAVGRARKDGNYAYAVMPDGHLRRIHTGNGDIPSNLLPLDGTRYLIDGAQYVLCTDGHFERAEVRNTDGQWLSGYDYCAA